MNNTLIIFDTSILSNNLGDEIIMDSINRILTKIFPFYYKYNVATHDYINKIAKNYIKQPNVKIIGGTNILSSNMNKYNQWKINLKDTLYLKNVILMGIGWWQYQNAPNKYTKLLLHRILSKKYFHSTRDTYTFEKLKSIGINNVLYTGCPTMWDFTKSHCELIPQNKSNEVVFTLTDYNKNEMMDKKLIEILIQNYEKIYFWPQGSGDYYYLKKIITTFDRIKIINTSLNAFKSILEKKDIEYVGTRLHGGILSLQKQRRSIIIAIDNRANEIEKDTGLITVKRDEIENLEKLINSRITTNIKLPYENINKWKKQFENINNKYNRHSRRGCNCCE